MLEVLQMTALRGRLVLFVKNALQMKRARNLDMGGRMVVNLRPPNQQ